MCLRRLTTGWVPFLALGMLLAPATLALARDNSRDCYGDDRDLNRDGEDGREGKDHGDREDGREREDDDERPPPPRSCNSSLELRVEDYQARTGGAAAPRFFVGRREVFPEGGVVRVPLTNRSGAWLEDTFDRERIRRNGLPTGGVLLVLRLGNGNAVIGQYGYMSRGSTYMRVRGKIVGGHFRELQNYAGDRFEGQGDGVATPGNTGQDEATRSGDEVVLRTTVSTAADLIVLKTTCGGQDLCAGRVCSAADQCHTAGTCDPATGQCSQPAKPNGAPCSDGNQCTTGDSCKAGACAPGTPTVCVPSDVCHDAGTCDAATGACSNPPKADGSSCDDLNACNGLDLCVSGVCTHEPEETCGDPPTVCQGPGTCDPATGRCHYANLDGNPCDDGDACTGRDLCEGGQCVSGTDVVCPAPANRCQVGVCDRSTGCGTANVPDGIQCDDGNACTQTDTCQAGVCTGANPVVCAALDACHGAGSCGATGCTYALLVDYASDVSNCGACASACALAHAAPACTGGTCVIAACQADFADCNRAAADGCETDLRNDAANCGACGHACAAGEVCGLGVCKQPCSILFTADGGSTGAPAIGADGTIYSVGMDGNIRAIDPGTGQLRWTTTVSSGGGRSGYYQIGGVVLDEQRIYVGGTDGAVHAYDYLGNHVWATAVGPDLEYATVTLGQGALAGAVIAVGGNLVQALNADGSVRWVYAMAGAIYSSSPASWVDGTLYITTWADGALYALNPDGTLKWRRDNGGGAVTSPAIGADGTIYTGNHGPADGYFRAFRPDGTELWRTAVGNFHGGAALSADGTIYVGNDYTLVAIRADGSVKWQASTGAGPEPWVAAGQLVGDDGNIYVPVDGNLSLAVMEPTQGRIVCQLPLGGWSSPPTLARNGVMFVGTSAGKLIAYVGTSHGIDAGSSWPKHHGDIANTGRSCTGERASLCRCTPRTCAQAAGSCGAVPDGCGGTIDCGGCASPQTCGGGGVANVCGCTPYVCNADGSCCPAPPAAAGDGLVLQLDAAAATGTGFPGVGCAASALTWSDLSSTGDHATLANFDACGAAGPGWQGTGTGGDPYRLSYDGWDDVVRVPDNAAIALTSGLTLEVWMKAPSIATEQLLLSKFDGSGGYYLEIYQSRPTFATRGNSWRQATTTLTSDVWYQVVATYDGATKSFFVNGQPAGSSADASGVLPTPAELRIGQYLSAGYPFLGSFAVVKLYNRALSASEVHQNCQNLEYRFPDIHCN